MELVPDSFYLNLFSLLFAVFVRCTVELFVLVSSVCHILDPRKSPEACFIRDWVPLSLSHTHTIRSEGEMKKYGCPVGWFVGTLFCHRWVVPRESEFILLLEIFFYVYNKDLISISPSLKRRAREQRIYPFSLR